MSLELGAYEELWSRPKMSFKRMAEALNAPAGTRPSDMVAEEDALQRSRDVLDHLRRSVDGWFGFRIRSDLDYPQRLLDAVHPVHCLYFQGDWNLISLPGVAVVGTRTPSDAALNRTRRLIESLVDDGFCVVSGLADGIDTAAHSRAIELGGKTTAVISTPLGDVYPRKNSELQMKIAKEHLLISQVPVSRYNRKNIVSNRFFFPERNKTMSALTKATVIVEAGNTSGTLTQAKAALEQGRKLFILNSCFENPSLSWPSKFEKLGAVRVREYDDIRRELVPEPSADR
jgi:DNA processing protein